MNELIDGLVRAVLIGTGATVVMDLWGVFQKHVLRISPLDYRLLGRWIGHFRHGRFVHDSIVRSEPARGELVIGWGAHYVIGISFAVVLLAIWGMEWARRPTLLPAMIVGWSTILAPFFLLQPGMGAGIAASKTPKPNLARMRSLVTHTIYGLGLYLSGEFWALVMKPRISQMGTDDQPIASFSAFTSQVIFLIGDATSLAAASGGSA